VRYPVKREIYQLEIPYLAYKVLVHWACAKVKGKNSNIPDTIIVNEIVSKLKSAPGVSFAEIAATADRAKRRQLATMLLDYEPRASEQVPGLIAMKENERALDKSIQSGDTDLVHMVLLHLRRSLPSNKEFFDLISRYETAMSIWILFCKQDVVLLKDTYSYLGRYEQLGNVYVKESFVAESVEQQKELLKQAVACYKRANSPSLKIADEQLRLLLLQVDLESTIGGEFINSSLCSTIYRVILLGNHKRATKIRSEFKVSDKKFWWLKIRALSEKGEWQELDKFSKEKKSPIGYRPFADVCLQKGEVKEAVKYIAKITLPAEKAEYYMRVSYWQEAVKVAQEAKSEEIMNEIKSRCTDPRILDQIGGRQTPNQ